MDAIIQNFRQIEADLRPSMRNLTPEENKKFAIGDNTKLFIDKVMDYHKAFPELRSTDVDWDEFERDYDMRKFLSNLAIRTKAVTNMLLETCRIYDHDNQKNALRDFNYAKYKDGLQAGQGYDTKVAELGQFFKGGRRGIISDGTDPI